ncbi:hypothetical protein BDQ17DRAFT_1234601, partial [Cyathus striatus]
PTPHQIFHLPRNATENEIKARYYELVRLYHPDKAGSSLSAEIAHARFQSITAAYDALRGKTPFTSDGLATAQGSYQDRSYQTTAAFRAAQRRRQELYSKGAADDSWKDKIILFGVISTILIVIAQTVNTRHETLAQVYAKKRCSQASSQNRLCDEERLALSANDMYTTNRMNDRPRRAARYIYNTLFTEQLEDTNILRQCGNLVPNCQTIVTNGKFISCKSLEGVNFYLFPA